MDILGKFRFSKTNDSPYRLLVEAIQDYAIYMLDRTGIVTSWNPGAQRFNGYTADEIVGEHFSRFYTEDDQKSGVPARALEAAARDGRFENEGWRVRKDGTTFGEAKRSSDFSCRGLATTPFACSTKKGA
jgi:PAS domain S-box-containing protein